MHSSTPPVGFIGLGKMGRPMARSLAQAGYKLRLHDVATQVAEDLADELGAFAAHSPAEAADESQMVILMLPNSGIVRDVVHGGDDGTANACVLAGMPSGGTIIDMSSSDPTDTLELGKVLQQHGMHLVDAPVSGGVKKAETGSLAILIGGRDEDIDRVEPILQAMGEKLLRTGPLGTGHTMKALNNFVSAAGLMAAEEALRIGTRFGIEAETIVDILNASTGRNNSTENKLRQFVLSETFASGFSLSLMAKDVNIAWALAQHIKMESPLLENCAGQWRKADSILPKDSDHTEFMKSLSND